MFKKHNLTFLLLIMISIIFYSCSVDIDKDNKNMTKQGTSEVVPRLQEDGVWISELQDILNDIKKYQFINLIDKGEVKDELISAKYNFSNLEFSFNSKSGEGIADAKFLPYDLDITNKGDSNIFNVKNIIDYRFIDNIDKNSFLVYITLDDLNVNRADTSIHFYNLENENINSYILSGQFSKGNKIYLNALDKEENGDMSLTAVNHKYLGSNSEALLIDIFKFNGDNFYMVNKQGELGITSMQEMDSEGNLRHKIKTSGDMDKYQYLLKEVDKDFLSDNQDEGFEYILGALEDDRDLFNAFNKDGEYDKYIIKNNIIKLKEDTIDVNNNKDKFLNIIKNEYKSIDGEDKKKTSVVEIISSDVDLFLSELYKSLIETGKTDKEAKEIRNQYRKGANDVLEDMEIELIIPKPKLRS